VSTAALLETGIDEVEDGADALLLVLLPVLGQPIPNQTHQKLVTRLTVRSSRARL